jgi:1-phosphofructokinase
MIVTVTPNPSLDRAIEVERLARGEVIRAASARVDPGGKGVNVSRALLAHGVSAPAVLPCGGDEGQQLVRLLRAEGVEVRAVPILGRTRSNITLAEPDGTVTKINEPGPELTAEEFEAIAEQAMAAAGTATWIVVSGSLPPGLEVAQFSQLCRRLVAAGARLAVDTSGPALRAAAEAGANLLKPNREELAEAVGCELTSIGDVVDAAQQLRYAGAQTVLASLGADGAVLVDPQGTVSGYAPVATPRSSVGAGDALLAGFLAAGADGAHALREGLTWAAAAVSLPGSRMPTPGDLRPDTVRIHTRPDTVRPLLAGG